MDLASYLMTIAASITAIGVLIVATKKVAAFVRSVVHLVDEVVGVPESDLLPGHPGISARLSAIEYELKPNGGRSMKDQINRLEEWTAAHSMVHHDLNTKKRVN